MSSEMFGRAGAGIEALAAKNKIQRLENRARILSQVFDIIYREMESACGDHGAGEVTAEDLAQRIYSWIERLAEPLDMLEEKL